MNVIPPRMTHRAPPRQQTAASRCQQADDGRKKSLKKLKASSYFIFHPNSVLQFLHDATLSCIMAAVFPPECCRFCLCSASYQAAVVDDYVHSLSHIRQGHPPPCVCVDACVCSWSTDSNYKRIALLSHSTPPSSLLSGRTQHCCTCTQREHAYTQRVLLKGKVRS